MYADPARHPTAGVSADQGLLFIRTVCLSAPEVHYRALRQHAVWGADAASGAAAPFREAYPDRT